jgi:hypothetical protein
MDLEAPNSIWESNDEWSCPSSLQIIDDDVRRVTRVCLDIDYNSALFEGAFAIGGGL